MDEQHKAILRRNRIILQREISAEKLATELLTASIIDEEDFNEVRYGEQTPERKADKLLDIITRKGPQAFSGFCESLKKQRQDLVDKILTPFSDLNLQEEECYNAACLRCSPKKFTGRKKLRSDMILKIRDFGYKLLLLVGPPGYGKSSLAVVVGHALKEEGFLVLYFELNKITTLKRAATLLLTTFQRAVSSDPERQLLEFLKLQLKRKTVLILDNTEDLQEKENEEFFQFLKDIGEFSSYVHVMVTTTQAIGRLQLLPFDAKSFPLQPLDENESKELWKKLCDHKNSENAFNVCELCKLCMGIPLILEVASSLVNLGTDILSLIIDLKQTPGVVLEEEQIAIKLKVFLSRIPADLKRTLSKLAVFPGHFSYNEAKFLFQEGPEFPVRVMMERLCNYSVLKFDEDAMTYKLHNVIQSIITKSRLDEAIHLEYNNTVVQFVENYMRILQAINIQFFSHDNMKALMHYKEQKQNIFHAFSLAVEFKQVMAVGVSTEVVNLLAKCMNIDEFQDVYGGMATLVTEDKKQHSDCLTSLGFKYLCYHGRENTKEAMKYLSEACRLQELCQCTNTFERAHAMSKLGLCKAMSGEQDAGESLIRKSIDIRERLLSNYGDNIWRILVSGGYCDYAMAIKKHNVAKALEIWEEKCLKTYQEILNTHPFTGTILQYIGDAYHQQEQYDKAEECKRKSLEMRKILLGENHQDTARSYNSLAHTLEALGKPENAVDMLMHALHVQVRGSASHEDICCTQNEIQRLKKITHNTVR